MVISNDSFTEFCGTCLSGMQFGLLGCLHDGMECDVYVMHEMFMNIRKHCIFYTDADILLLSSGEVCTELESFYV